MKLFVFAAGATTDSLLQLTAAKPSFVVRIPNGANVPDVPAVGHADPEGSTRDLNVFGDDFQKAGKKWTVALCQMDSDGDGQRNGQELGDPCCEWVQTTNEVLRWTDGVSDPGVKTKVSCAKLLASVTCPGDSVGSTPVATTVNTTTATAAPASMPAVTSKSTTSSSSSTSFTPAVVTPSGTTSPAASSTNSPSSNSTTNASTTPSTSTTPSSSISNTPTATLTRTSAAAGLSLGFPTLTLLSGVAVGAIAGFRG
ncbi:hypothetical protein Gpo141_00004694 [Globisporangium polare]